MSRFANPRSTGRFVLGPCACPGTPHDEDVMVLRTELGTLELVELDDADAAGALRILLVDWNLLDDDGTPAPIDDDHLRRLYTDSFEALNGWVSANVRVAAIPKAPGGRSRSGSRSIASLFTRTSRAVR